MLTYDEALARILESVPGPLPKLTEDMLVHDTDMRTLSDSPGAVYYAALYRPLAEDVIAEIDLPPFDNSAVDGFAVRVADTESATKETPVALRITQTVAAGYAPKQSVGPGEAARIFTGAMLPEGADAIIMVEDTTTEGDTVYLNAPPSPSFIRRIGSDIAHGAVAVPAGTRITAGVMGLLAALNVPEVTIHRLPRVGIVSTGDELAAPFVYQSLQPGQIYESNGTMLTVAAQTAGAGPVHHCGAKDTPDDTKQALDSLRNYDVIIASGGVSVGDRDFVKSVVEEHGELNFWRVAIKPGKPLAFGRYGNALFFGLPGNPVSSLVTFELFVRPVIRKLAGFRDVTRPMVSAILDEPLRHEPGRREFVRVRLSWQEDTYHATTTGAQGSHRLSSLLGADAFLIAHEDHSDYAAGDRLPAMLLR
jgi:molybdopterin molybdotransferase